MRLAVHGRNFVLPLRDSITLREGEWLQSHFGPSIMDDLFEKNELHLSTVIPLLMLAHKRLGDDFAYLDNLDVSFTWLPARGAVLTIYPAIKFVRDPVYEVAEKPRPMTKVRQKKELIASTEARKQQDNLRDLWRKFGPEPVNYAMALWSPYISRTYGLTPEMMADLTPLQIEAFGSDQPKPVI